jgi:hypothetical protein
VGRHAAAARSQVSGSWLDTLVYVSILFDNFRFGTDLVVSVSLLYAVFVVRMRFWKLVCEPFC